MLAGFESGDGVGLVKLVRGQVEDDVDIVACEDGCRVCGGERDTELGGAVLRILLVVSGDELILFSCDVTFFDISQTAVVT